MNQSGDELEDEHISWRKQDVHKTRKHLWEEVKEAG